MAVIARVCPRHGPVMLVKDHPSGVWRCGMGCREALTEVEYVPASQLRGAVDALDFALRIVNDHDLSEREVRQRIGDVVFRTLNQKRGQ